LAGEEGEKIIRRKKKERIVQEAGSRRQHPKNKPPARRRYGASVGCHDNVVQTLGAGCVQRRLIPDIALGEKI
jgi:hypothetical protein